MLVVEMIARIRREHFIKGKKIKEIARDLKVVAEHGPEGVEAGGDLVRVRAAGAAAAKAMAMGVGTRRAAGGQRGQIRS